MTGLPRGSKLRRSRSGRGSPASGRACQTPGPRRPSSAAEQRPSPYGRNLIRDPSPQLQRGTEAQWAGTPSGSQRGGCSSGPRPPLARANAGPALQPLVRTVQARPPPFAGRLGPHSRAEGSPCRPAAAISGQRRGDRARPLQAPRRAILQPG